MRRRKTKSLKKPLRPLDITEPRTRKPKPLAYRNSPLVYLQNGPRKERYRKELDR